MAETESDEIEVATIDEALAWAAERGARVSVIVGDEAWDEPPDAEDRQRIDDRIARDRERFARETRAYEEPVEWFWAVLGLDTDDPERVAEAVNADPAVLSARVHRRLGRGGAMEVWVVVRATGRTLDKAHAAAHGAVFRHIWPEERLAALPDGPFYLSIGQHELHGLADFEDDDLL